MTPERHRLPPRGAFGTIGALAPEAKPHPGRDGEEEDRRQEKRQAEHDDGEDQHDHRLAHDIEGVARHHNSMTRPLPGSALSLSQSLTLRSASTSASS